MNASEPTECREVRWHSVLRSLLIIVPHVGWTRRWCDLLIPLLRRVAVLCFDHGLYSQAQRALLRILRARPDDKLSTIILAHVYLHLGFDEAAINLMEAWLKGHSDDAECRLALSQLYARQNSLHEAKKHLDIASETMPTAPNTLLAIGYYHRCNGDLNASSVVYQRHLDDAVTPQGLFRLARNLIDQGQKVEAITALERAITLAPDLYSVYYYLARCDYYKDPAHPHIAFLQAALKDSRLPASAESSIHFTLGAILDKLGRYDKAFSHFRQANDCDRRWELFDMKDFEHFTTRLMGVFNPEFLTNWQAQATDHAGSNLIFVFGMPRSGTSLVEQILASHPDVWGGGETQHLHAILHDIACELKQPYPELARGLNRVQTREMADRYLSRLPRMGIGARRFVDKSLDTGLFVGLITAVLPGAKLIHCQRDPLDTCLSCYCNSFKQVHFSNDLYNLGAVYREHVRLMSYWVDHLPGRSYNVRYEDLVGHPDAHIRNLLVHCGLPWNRNCLNPHQTSRVVQTVSQAQVKEPINDRSIGRWKNYEKHLAPLKRGLG